MSVMISVPLDTYFITNPLIIGDYSVRIIIIIVVHITRGIDITSIITIVRVRGTQPPDRELPKYL